MKKLLLFFLILSTGLKSQTNAEEKLMDKLCTEACDAINRGDFKNGEDKDALTTKLGFALLEVYNKNTKEIKKVYGLDVTQPDDARKMGEKLGAVLVFKCAKFKDIVIKMTQDEDLSRTDVSNSDSDVHEVNASIESFECNELCSFVIKTNDGETLKIYRMEKFPGSEYLDNYFKIKNTSKALISYKMMSIFLASAKKHQTIKVFTEIKY